MIDYIAVHWILPYCIALSLSSN